MFLAQPIPLSVWPYVLARADTLSHQQIVNFTIMQLQLVQDLSGLYHLLRHGGALTSRTSFVEEEYPTMMTTQSASSSSGRE